MKENEGKRFIYHKVCRQFIVGIHYARVTTSEVSNTPRTGVPSWWIHQWPWLGVCCILRVVAGPGKIIELEALRGHSFTVNVLLLFLPVLVLEIKTIILSEACITNPLF